MCVCVCVCAHTHLFVGELGPFVRVSVFVIVRVHQCVLRTLLEAPGVLLKGRC